ncbi:Gfo/Idh/MocA family protein [Streptomyces rochei]|uniref:Gfo/Idh/MocA family protein n=1 Tax=Streptomyces rochei TaxID=1928 RepID=UPI003690FDAD
MTARDNRQQRPSAPRRTSLTNPPHQPPGPHLHHRHQPGEQALPRRLALVLRHFAPRSPSFPAGVEGANPAGAQEEEPHEESPQRPAYVASGTCSGQSLHLLRFHERKPAVRKGDSEEHVCMRVGVIGLRMGLHLADWCHKVGLEVVAACDRDPERRAVARAQLPEAALVEQWQELLEHRLDGVVLANDVDEHAPLAIAFLDRGVHVLSESAACVDAAEGERLIAAADRSSATYSFAENYVAHPHVRLLRQATEAGELGRISLTEADCLHGMSPDEVAGLIGDPTHSGASLPRRTARTPSHRYRPSRRPGRCRCRRSRLTRRIHAPRSSWLCACPPAHWPSPGTGSSKTSRQPLELDLRTRHQGAGRVRPDHRRTVLVRPRQHGKLGSPRKPRTRGGTHPFTLAGEPVTRGAEGTVRILRAFRATMTQAEPPLVPVRPAVAASLAGAAGAESLANDSRPLPVPVMTIGRTDHRPPTLHNNAHKKRNTTERSNNHQKQGCDITTR